MLTLLLGTVDCTRTCRFSARSPSRSLTHTRASPLFGIARIRCCCRHTRTLSALLFFLLSVDMYLCYKPFTQRLNQTENLMSCNFRHSLRCSVWFVCYDYAATDINVYYTHRYKLAVVWLLLLLTYTPLKRLMLLDVCAFWITNAQCKSQQ